jgi:CheY-like chemotaxis protein
MLASTGNSAINTAIAGKEAGKDMSKTTITPQEYAELKRLAEEYAKALEHGFEMLRHYGIESPQFREADRASGETLPAYKRATGNGREAVERLLVVDDDNAVRDVVVRMLSANGFGVLTASDGPEALRILGQGSVDLLFTDVVMPGMDGVELARQARQVRPGLKVLFGTGYAQKAIERDAIHQARVVYKPFRQAELVKEIETLLAA